MAIKPIKVSQLNGYIKRVLQSDPLLGNVSVIGEVSNLKHHGSGHIYFTLKDELSKINCFLGADLLKDIHFEFAEGMEITATGYIAIYERGGTYSLNIRDIQVEGIGNLSVAFEKLKEKLAKEGLFDEKQKKSISLFPHNIALVTSETGAAVKDIIKIIKNRNNIVNVMIFPVLVQGPNAAGEISEAIYKVNELYPQTDTIIIGRGGGSIEELWAFNEEIVARSIFASKIPIISAVGHEIDFTISDFVADKRAETPTAAAQMAVPDISELKEYIFTVKDSIHHLLGNKMRYYEMSVAQYNVLSLRAGLADRIDNAIYKSDHLKKEMENKVLSILSEYKNTVEMSKQMLESLNPTDILRRGYVAITDRNGLIISSVEYFNKGDSLTASFIDGVMDCRVEEIRGENIGEK
ncbi:MAG: exodeoxyribonuclease VII large subunit [Peptostreptococcaceae bacterium]|nr:exodeoxyribonuclease VII large subunit [Peptostreptococcaceae bacterium]